MYNIELRYDPEIALLGVYPGEMKIMSIQKKNLYTSVHSSVVHNGQKWKQPTFLFTNKWITKIKNNNQWIIKIKMCYYSAVKRNGHMLQHG